MPIGYSGVELGAGVLDTTVSGTASAGGCAVPPMQLVVLDAPPDQTTSLCNNSNALVAGFSTRSRTIRLINGVPPEVARPDGQDQFPRCIV